jgi:flavin reductase (DIM6/NTAB) family NADH-FMN oxidoreductase RutF
MFYRPEESHGLRANPLNAIVVPRPIGWISSLSPDGRPNLAPYSFFNAVAYRPPQVMFAATGAHEHGGLKDSVANIAATREFVVNLATWDLREAMNASSIAAPPGYDEFAHAGLTKAPAIVVRPPRVAESPVQLECVLSQLVELEAPSPEKPNRLVIGRVVGIHIADSVIENGIVAIARLDAIARLGYDQYARVRDLFTMTRPRWPEDAA